jgi:hydroxypyruvate isomerase
VRVLYDVYHLAVMGEDVIGDIDESIDLIGHFHVADTPGRTEPGSGEIDYAGVFAMLEEHDYSGAVGYECSPTNGESTRVVREIFE